MIESELYPKYRPDIDGLRAVAVLLVVFYHCFPGFFHGGFIGVDIFFVISGFLISSILISNLECDRFSLVRFYVRRIRRIFPTLLLVMICSLMFGWKELFADEYLQLSKHIATGAAFLLNIVLYRESGYFDNTALTKPMLHLWSLAIEEQFYILWPLLLAFLWRRKWTFLRIIIIIGVLSFLANIYLAWNNPSAAFYWPFSRFWELMIGGLLAYLSLHYPTFISRGANLKSSVGCILLLSGAVLITSRKPFPGWWALLPTLGAAFVIAAGPTGWFNRHFLSNKIFVWIGLISYPLYLWHWPILSFIRIVRGGFGEDALRISIPLRLLVITLAIGISWLTYQFIEMPIRVRGGNKTALSLLSVMIVISCVSLFVMFDNGVESRAAVRVSGFSLQAARQFSGPLWTYTNNKNCLNRFSLPGAENYAWWFCMLDKDQPPTAIILGTSYANQLYPGLAHEPALSHHNFLSIGTCDPSRDHRPGSTEPAPNSPCLPDRRLEEERFIDNIIAGNRSIRLAILDGLEREPDPTYIHKLKERIDFLESKGIKVVVFVPHLVVDFDIRECYSRFLFPARRQCTVPVGVRNSLDAKFRPLIEAIHASNPHVLFFDQNDLFCDKEECHLIQNGLPLYRDEYHHLSIFASERDADLFVAFARGNLPEVLD